MKTGTMPDERGFMSRVALASFIGALLEWYDFFIFGTAAAVAFGPVFFPTQNPLRGMMGAFAIYGVGFLARPLGGIFFGHIGDRHGRKAGLLLTLAIIGTGTFLIGLLPGWKQAGIAAPLMLMALRLLQGFGLGGEYGGAALITIEHAPDARRGFWGAIPQAAASAGILLATGVFAALDHLSKDAFLAWGWRIPFLISIIFTGVGIFIRMSVIETPAFLRVSARREEPGPPLIQLFRDHPRNIVLATIARLAETVSSNIINAFGIAYIVKQLMMDRSIGLNAMMLASLIGIIMCPVFGAISDRIGRRKMYLAGAAFMFVFSVPFFLLLGTKSVGLIVVAFVVAYNFGPTLMFAVEANFFSDMFGAATRYTGLSLAYQLSAIIGGFMPLIGASLIGRDAGQPWLLAGFLSVICLLSFICAALAKLNGGAVGEETSYASGLSHRPEARRSASV